MDQTIPADQALQATFAKVGQLEFTIDIMRQQIITLEGENKRLNDQLNPPKEAKGDVPPILQTKEAKGVVPPILQIPPNAAPPSA